MLTIGTVKVRGNKKRTQGPKPKGPEELRKLHRVMWTAWTVVRLKHLEQRALQGIGREVYEELLDYVLGEKCWERSAVGKSISWDGLLTYELQIRKEAAKHANRGKGSLAEGIRFAMRDANLRTEYYVEAVAMAGVKRTRSPTREAPQRDDVDAKPPNDRKVNGKGKKGKGEKGKGKGGKGSNRQNRATKMVNEGRHKEKLKYTSDVGGQQRPTCLRYNRLDACADCKFEHICLRCGGSHPLIDCQAPLVWR